MPLFYLHIRTDGDLIIDEDGSRHASLAAAVLEAVRGARPLMSSEVKAGHLRMDQSIEVFDEEGQHMSTVTFSEALSITPANDAALKLASCGAG